MFIYIASVTFKIVSRRFTESQGLTPTKGLNALFICACMLPALSCYKSLCLMQNATR